MLMEETVNPEATYTACRIIYAIIESIIFEKPQFELSKNILQKIPSLINNNVHYTNGISISYYSEYMEVKINLNLIGNQGELINELRLLQEQIMNEVLQLTGIKISRVDIVISKIYDA